MTRHTRLAAAALLVALCSAPAAMAAGRGGQGGPELTDLPLVEVPAALAGGRRLAVILSGDGDWAPTVRTLGQRLSARGVAVVGLKSRSYLSRRPTPDETAHDIERILRHYRAKWDRDEVVLIGYSRGADFIPFVLNRLPADLRASIRGAALIGPGEKASFEFHLTDLVKDTPRPTDIPVLPELERIQGVPMLCVYGSDEPRSLCKLAPAGRMTLLMHPGGHRLKDEEMVIDRVTRDLSDER